ncbi:MAG: lamin tail domain-containing protein [bacterium]|nr:lamin tail domain-containing protein [bacterium]
MKGFLVLLIVFYLLFFNVALVASSCININTAPKEELKEIRHIGEARAEQIINLRKEKLFSSVDELARVKGIGPARLSDIKEQGLACVHLQPQPHSQVQAEPDKSVIEEAVYPTPTVEVGLQQTYPAGVVINEILPFPVGPDAEEEWIEVFNQNNFEVDLSGWQIADTAGKTHTLPVGKKIPAQGFLVLPRPTTKITLNNDEDGLSLIQPNGSILDSVNYQKAPQGQSYNRTESGWVWSSTLTPGLANITPAPSSKIKDKEKNKEEPQKELATVSESFRQIQEKQISKPLFVFLIAFGLAIFSGAIILIFKKRLKSAKIER